MKRSFSIFLCLMTVISVFSFASAEGSDSTLTYSFSAVFNSVMEGRPSCTAEKTKLGEADVVKVIPNTESGTSDAPCLDSWSLASGGKRADITKYRFMSVEYFLEEGAAFDGRMMINLLPGSTKALKSTASVYSEDKLVKGRWATAYFKLDGKLILNPDSENKHINQIHFYPFEKTPASRLSEKDVIYIKSLSFHESNPDKDAKVTVTFEKGRENALGKLIIDSVTARTDYTLPECSYTLSDGEFEGWKDSDGKLCAPGTVIALTDRDLVFTASWSIFDASSDAVSLSFTDYQNGIVDARKTTSSYIAGDYDGVNAMKAVIDPNGADSGKPLVLDGWSYSSALIDLNYFKYAAILYRFDSEKTLDSKPRINIMKSADLTSSFASDAEESVEGGKWSFAIFDLSKAEERFIPEADRHIIKQIHIYPLGTTPVSSLDDGDSVCVSKVMFFKERPTLTFVPSYIGGYPDGSFKPEGTIKRSEAIAMVSRIYGGVTDAVSLPYTDVSESDWFFGDVKKLYASGTLGCFDGDKLDADRPITRAELASVILATGLSAPSVSPKSFTDVPSGHRFFSEISAAASAGLINGYPDGSFKPDKSITRHEAVIILNRALGRSGQNNTHDFFCVFSDVYIGHKGFYDISSAAVSYIENGGEFLDDAREPSEFIAENTAPNFAPGDSIISEIDAKTAARIAEIRAAKDDHSSITGTKYYVSPSGNDSNDGLSPEKAFATIGKINSMKFKYGDGVLFERGGIYRDEIKARSGVTYAAYGEGEKPIICGSPEDGADPSKWSLHLEKDGMKIWKYYREDYADIGNITFNGGELYAKREVPNYRNGTFYVRETEIPFDIGTHLAYDLCYFHKADSVLEQGGVPEVARARGPLYLRCDRGNPGEVFSSIEFGTKRRGVDISGTADVTIDNLHIRYCGAAGIGGTGPVYDLTVKNCEAGWLGGVIQTYRFGGNTSGRVTRAGNGIETYGTTDGFTVKNCYVHDVYDAGLSHQVSSGGNQHVDMSNISYINNVVENCVYGIEYFNGAPAVSGIHRTGTNILMEGNIIRFSGYGFGTTRPDGHCQAAIKSWDHRNEFESFRIKNNIFDRSIEYLLHISAKYPEWMPIMDSNTYIQTFGKTFINYRGERPDTFFDMASVAANTIGDKNAVTAYTRKDATGERERLENIARFGQTEMYE